MPKKGYKHPPDCAHCAERRESMKGNTLTLGKKMPDSHRESARERALGNKLASRKHSDEENQRQSERMKILNAKRPELGAAQSERMKGNQFTLGWNPPEEWRKKQSGAKKRRWASLSEDERQAFCLKMASLWTDEMRAAVASIVEA